MFTKLHVGLVILVKRMSVLVNFLLQNTKLVSVLGQICPNFAGLSQLTVLKNFFFFNFYLGYIGQESDFNTVLG
jgi:hypothetical protein